MCSTHVRSSLSRKVVKLGRLNAGVDSLDDLLTNDCWVNFYGQSWLLLAQAPNSESNFVERNLERIGIETCRVSTCQWRTEKGLGDKRLEL